MAELKDSDTIAKLLEFRCYFRQFDDSTLKTQLITEVADSENIEIIRAAGVKDFLISNKFVSKIYAQVSEEPDILQVYDQLFSEEGSEVYLKPVTAFMNPIPAQVTFADMCAAALRKGESCIGVRFLDEAESAEKEFGIRLNPPKSETFALQAGDCLITLAEDET